MNIHETVMQLLGGRTVPLAIIVIGFFSLSGTLSNEESTMKLLLTAKEFDEKVYAYAVAARDITLWSILLVVFATAMWSIRKPNGNHKDE